MIALFLIFWGNSLLFFTMAVWIYRTTNRVPVFPFLNILANIYLFFIMIKILTDLRWHLVMISIFISLSLWWCWAHFHIFLAICILPTLKLSCFLLLSCGTLYILSINLLSDIFANIFSHSIGCLFILSILFIAVQKFLSLGEYHLFILVLVLVVLMSYPKSPCQHQCQGTVSLCFILGVL